MDNSSFRTHTKPISISNENFPLYFSEEYATAQEHERFLCFESDHLFLPVVLQQDQAISIPKSPFGSFFIKQDLDMQGFGHFLEQVKERLRNQQIKVLTLNHPSPIYPSFVPAEWLQNAGFSCLYEEINQHVVLDNEWERKLHNMQQRKLSSLQAEGFEFRKIPTTAIEMMHNFIGVCRQAQGLQINITLERLKHLVSGTCCYDFFGVFREDRISSACIVARVTPKIAYYFLPATSPMFRSQSPMVLLLQGMVSHYRSEGFEYFDLGISSIEGKPQETLRLFKNRMGAMEISKPTWKLLL